jgi:hypothetical protein
MKKLFITLVLACATLPAMAQHWHGLRHHGHRHGGPGIGWWVAPVIVGAIGYELGKQQTVVVQQPPVVVQNPPVVVQRQSVCTEWKEIQNPDGTIYRERTCSQ